MLNVNFCRTPASRLAVLGSIAVAFFGIGVVAADEAPVVLYETNHLGFGEAPFGLGGTYGVDVAIDDDALMVAGYVGEGISYVTSYQQLQSGALGNRVNFTSGVSVDIEGQRALVGNRYRCQDDQGYIACADGNEVGGVDYFEQAGDGSWILRQSMRPTASDLYAFSFGGVELSGSTAVATAALASGWFEDTAVLVFEQHSGVWEEVYEIRFDGSGSVSIAIDGDTLLIGDAAAEAGGVVHMYRLNARGHWRPRGTFAPAGLQPDAEFGASVAIDGNRAVVGAPGANIAFVFERSTASGPWRERARLEAEPVAAAWAFGASVALDGDIALVGRPEVWRGIDGQSGTGSVHVFVRESRSEWTRKAVLVSSDGRPRSAFGSALEIDGNGVVVGSRGLGAAYFYDLSTLFDGTWFVDVDVKPGSDDNLLDPDSTGNVWVAVLSTMDFDALQVDPATVTLGPGAARPNRGGRVADTNGDGLPDLELRFAIPEVGLSCDAATLQLTGATYAGQAIAGQAIVEAFGCDEIVVRVKPLSADRGVVDLAESGFKVFLMSEPGFDPADVVIESIRLGDQGVLPRGYHTDRDFNKDGVPDLTLRYKTKDVSFTCGNHDLEVEAAIVDDPADYPWFRRRYAGTLRITVIGC